MNPIKQIKKLIQKNKVFLIAAHHNPDADAIASCLAMALLLKMLGKKVIVANEDDVPTWLKFLPQSNMIKKASTVKPMAYDVAIVLDCGDKARIGGVEKLLCKEKPLINIDHHVTNDRFGQVNLIVPKASSTCEIVYDLIKVFKVDINKSLATLLYAGIMTDTGSFRYENTSARVHDICAHLMSFGLHAQELYERLYVGMPVADMKLFAKVIHEAELLQDGRVYCVTLSQNSSATFSKTFDLKDKLFGFLRSVEGIEVVVILTEINSKETRINLRSQGDFNVADLASKFNGGGHVKAAGAKIYAGLKTAKEQILKAIAKQLKDK